MPSYSCFWQRAVFIYKLLFSAVSLGKHLTRAPSQSPCLGPPTRRGKDLYDRRIVARVRILFSCARDPDIRTRRVVLRRRSSTPFKMERNNDISTIFGNGRTFFLLYLFFVPFRKTRGERFHVMSRSLSDGHRRR